MRPPRHDERRLAVRAQRLHRLRRRLLEEPLRHRELGLDVRLGAVGTDHARPGRGAREQPDRLREHRLAGPRFAREHVQAGSKLELCMLDQRQVVDLQPQQRHVPKVSR